MDDGIRLDSAQHDSVSVLVGRRRGSLPLGAVEASKAVQVYAAELEGRSNQTEVTRWERFYFGWDVLRSSLECLYTLLGAVHAPSANIYRLTIYQVVAYIAHASGTENPDELLHLFL